MPSPSSRRSALWLLASLSSLPLPAQSQPWRPEIPRTWDPAALATLELPNAVTGVPARHVAAEFYYRIPAMVIHRTYPVYHPDHEPPGYRARLEKATPEIVFDPAKLATRADWVAAGEAVFHWPIELVAATPERRERFRALLAKVPTPMARDGVLPYFRYVVRKPGVVEFGRFSCAMCHSRVMDDGTVIYGAQGNLPFDRHFAEESAHDAREQLLGAWAALFGMPERAGARPPYPADLTTEQMRAAHAAIPGGVLARHGTSAMSPVQVPDLIGIADRRYLDRTGLLRHRDIGDLMRYAALNQDLDMLSEYGGFVPDLAALALVPEKDPPPGTPTRDQLRARILDPDARFRYSDEQLYALALFLYDLEPPRSPYPFDALARRGQEVFEAEDCRRCHTPPHYTSNELVPAPGFTVPDHLRATEAIRRRGVGTDPTLTTTTRRGTGFYKTPALKGVWYRGPFHHDGSIATLEEWFDPARLRDDHVPKGWNPGGGRRAVPGHEFGLDLPEADRKALIAFLRTL